MSKVIIKPIDFEKLRALLDAILFSEGEGDDLEAFVYTVAKAGSSESNARIVDEAVANAFVERMNSLMPYQGNPLDAFSYWLSECLAKLEKAVEENNVEEIEGCIHILKSIAALLGARDLEGLPLGLESAAMKGGSNFRPTHWLMLINEAVIELRRILIQS
ncbi:MAG: hypothetical protein P8L49_02775 [Opitutaceae bacterium]|nr:hypothetical protein [Opitutaceae bacterium]